jgi:hypothetical protein
LIRTLESALSDPTIDKPQISLQAHLRRAISSISQLVASLLGYTASLPISFNLKSQPTNLPISTLPPSTARGKLKICGLALHRVLLLGNCWSLSEHDTPSAADLVVQVTRDIIVPLISTFHILSCRYAEESFGISLLYGGDRAPMPMTKDTEPLECIVDLREECARILVQLLDPHAQPRPPPTTMVSRQSQSTRSDTSTEFICLSGTTAGSSVKTPTEGVPQIANEWTTNWWFGDIILHICATEIVRITTTAPDNNPQDGGVDANGMHQAHAPNNPPQSGDHPSPSRQEKEQVMRIVREEAIWYLCSLIHAATGARTHARTKLQYQQKQREQDRRHTSAGDITSSFEIVRRARDTLMNLLLADRAFQRPHSSNSLEFPVGEARNNGDGRGLSTEFSRRTVDLGILERETIFAAVEALNECCDSPWEEDDGYETEDVDRSAVFQKS